MDAVIQNDGECVKISSAHTVEFEIDENGNYIYRFMDENGTIATLNGYVKYPERTSKIVYFMDIGGGVRSGTLTFVNELTEENGRIYLNVDGGVDITDDFADGIATGTFYTSIADCENELFKYTVKGTLEDYTVKIEWVEQ